MATNAGKDLLDKAFSSNGHRITEQDFRNSIGDYMLSKNSSNSIAVLDKFKLDFGYGQDSRFPVVDFNDKQFIEDTITILSSKSKIWFDFTFNTMHKMDLEITPSSGFIQKVCQI